MTDELDLLGERDEITPEGFAIDTLERAEWALRKKARAQADIDRATKYAAALISRIALRLDQITKPHKATVETMDALLKPWAAVEVAKASGRKSVKLIGGTVGFRSSPASLLVTDERAAVAWLEEHGEGDMIRIKKEVDKKAVKAAIESSGEIPDGVELKPGETKFYAECEPLDRIESKEA